MDTDVIDAVSKTAKWRVVRDPGYMTIYSLERRYWFGWKKVASISANNMDQAVQQARMHFAPPTVYLD